MQRLGFLTAEEARHHPEKSQLYRALGVSPLVQIDLIENIPLKSDEYFLLCTDGMAKIEDWEIQEIVLSNSPQQACHKLIELANERGGSDNVTMQVIRIQTAEARSEKMRGIIRKWWRRF
jgi:protein phosphatase